MNDHPTLTDHFRIFLQDRPSISPDRLAKELDIDRLNLGKIIIGIRNIPAHRRGDFYRLMLHYGWQAQPQTDKQVGKTVIAPDF